MSGGVEASLDSLTRTWLEFPARILAIAAAIWLIAAPSVLDYGGVAEANDRIVGPIAGSFAFVACWEVLMPMRWPTLPCGIWLMVSPAVFGYDDAVMWISSMVAGFVIAVTAFVGRDVRDKFDGGWRSVRPSAWRADPA